MGAHCNSGILVLHPASTVAGRPGPGLTLTEFKLGEFQWHAGRRSPGLGSCVRRAMSAMVASVPSMTTYDDCAQSSEPSIESMIDTVRGVGYKQCRTPPQPRWIISESINRCK